ncbi:MAG: hypothetical protein KatS3mg113_0165 [Planctomycetaceae bacterium]|nr:MAG: hypothetical protein KatS3mg113_0165 [Planctomycetaceae bacterium]
MWRWSGWLCCLCLVGCGGSVAESVPPHEYDQPLSEQQWEQFREVLERVGPEEARSWGCVWAPLPAWTADRTLSVSDLMAEEESKLAAVWQPETWTSRWEKHPRIIAAMHAAGLTPEQFAGLWLAVHAAYGRSLTTPAELSSDWLRKTEQFCRLLAQDGRIVSTLSPDDFTRVQDLSLWLHRRDRLHRLQRVPADNVVLIQRHRDWLQQYLPACAQESPLATFSELLGEHGLPFIELPETGNDLHLPWDRHSALGRDTLKQETAGYPAR